MADRISFFYNTDKLFMYNINFPKSLKDNKIKFKYENQETSELSILELIYSEKEKMLTKVDLYISINNEIEESLHIRKETKDSYELSYFPSNNQRVKVNNMNKFYQLSIYQNYSDVDNEMYLGYTGRTGLITVGNNGE